LYYETPINPTLELIDIAAVVKATRQAEKRFGRKILTMIDNTFGTLVNQRPFDFGVDVILESATKYLGGHSDIMAGAVISTKAIIKKVQEGMKYYGGCMDPFAAFLLARSLKTFELRVQKQNENAMMLARFLEKHPKVKRVLYPGLKSHPQHALARRQMTGFGGMVTAELKGGLRAATAVADNLNVALNASSLGGVETLVSLPVCTSHIIMSEAEV
jgi:cystathionine gamma-synthase